MHMVIPQILHSLQGSEIKLLPLDQDRSTHNLSRLSVGRLDKHLNRPHNGCIVRSTDTLKKLFPSTPGLNMIDKILDYAYRSVAGAEQMYNASQIPA